jgi:ribosomal protein S18 acetylase RimI-like enzyme
MTSLNIVTLTKELVEQILPQIVTLDRNIINELGMSYSHIIWQRSNFLLDLPEKWRLSKVAFLKKKLVGFWIASQKKKDYLYIHRVGVQKDVRRLKIGQKMFERILSEGKYLGLKNMALTVSVLNHGAIAFYEKDGFRKLSYSEIKKFLHDVGKKALVVNDKIRESGSHEYFVYTLCLSKKQTLNLGDS